MKVLLIILGLTASQIQQRSNMDLDVANLYDLDGRKFQGPITVRYQIGKAIIDLPDSEFVGLSFEMGILTSVDVTPHRRPLDSTETAKLCHDLEQRFSSQGSSTFVFSPTDAKEFHDFVSALKIGRKPTDAPPWRFGWKMGSDAINVVVRDFDTQRYTIMLEFGNSKLSNMVSEKMDTIRKKYFLNRRQEIPMSEYPKQ